MLPLGFRFDVEAIISGGVAHSVECELLPVDLPTDSVRVQPGGATTPRGACGCARAANRLSRRYSAISCRQRSSAASGWLAGERLQRPEPQPVPGLARLFSVGDLTYLRVVLVQECVCELTEIAQVDVDATGLK